MSNTDTIHVTEIRNGSDVWGHGVGQCDEGGCATGAELFYSQVEADEVEKGHSYEIDENGKVLAELVD